MPVSRRGDPTRLDGFELEIFKLVREHATIKQWREWLRAPLEHAAAVGNMDLFTRLMDAGADGSASWWDCNERTLLGAASQGKSEEMVMALIKAGHDVDVKFGGRKETALHVAAAHGAENSASALILAGADPSVLDGYRSGPLHRAAEAGHDGVVNILLLKGVDPDTRRRFKQQTPLHLAAEKGHVQCVSKLLFGGADKDSRSSTGGTPLLLAAERNHVAVVEQLLAAGADSEIRAAYFTVEYRPLDIAANLGHVDVVRALLRRGSSVKTSENEHGFTSLHRAACCDRRGDNGDVIRVLLEAGADIEAKTNDGSTPLHGAAYERLRTSGTILALLQGGASVDVRMSGDYTPLHLACQESCVCNVEALLHWGADETLTTSSGETAEDMLGEWDRRDLSGDEDEDAHIYADSSEGQERSANDQRIRHMLARAPADRCWRRRGWLVLARSCPTTVQLAQDTGGGSNSSGCSTKTAKTGRNGSDDRETADLARLVGRVVGLDVEDIFRLVVGFL